MTLSTDYRGLTTHSLQSTFSCYDMLPLRSNLLWRIERGIVRTLTWTEEGTIVTLGYWGEKDVVGQPLSRVHPYQIECLTSVEVTCIPSHWWHEVLDAIISHAQQSEELLNILHQERIYQRLQQLLVWLAKKFGRRVELGELIDLRLTHQAIAEIVGTSRVTVTRLLKQLEEDGIINRQQRQYIILRDRL